MECLLLKDEENNVRQYAFPFIFMRTEPKMDLLNKNELFLRGFYGLKREFAVPMPTQILSLIPIHTLSKPFLNRMNTRKLNRYIK